MGRDPYFTWVVPHCLQHVVGGRAADIAHRKGIRKHCGGIEYLDPRWTATGEVGRWAVVGDEHDPTAGCLLKEMNSLSLAQMLQGRRSRAAYPAADQVDLIERLALKADGPAQPTGLQVKHILQFRFGAKTSLQFIPNRLSPGRNPRIPGFKYPKAINYGEVLPCARINDN